jgi:hypothetical protein
MTGRQRREPPLPTMMPAAQLESIVAEIRERREQLRALQAQMAVFEEQLAWLESSLTPLLEWTRNWAGMEKAMLDFWRLPSTGGSSGRSSEG